MESHPVATFRVHENLRPKAESFAVHFVICIAFPTPDVTIRNVIDLLGSLGTNVGTPVHTLTQNTHCVASTHAFPTDPP